jgi:hypothetical protein
MTRENMNEALKEIFLPALRSAGFKGTLPHFRRTRKECIDLLTIQFDKYGGGFVVEISKCNLEGMTTYWGKVIPPTKVTAHDMHPNQRHRLGSPAPGQDGHWFRFDNGTTTHGAADSLCTFLPEAERWWTQPNQSPE